MKRNLIYDGEAKLLNLRAIQESVAALNLDKALKLLLIHFDEDGIYICDDIVLLQMRLSFINSKGRVGSINAQEEMMLKLQLAEGILALSREALQ